VGSISYSEYKWNKPTEVLLPGGSKRQYEYDPLMRVKSIIAKDPGANILMNYQYNYDRVDNIKAKITEHGSYSYDYDDLYRLTSADNPVQADEAYTYDSVGNRLTDGGVEGNWDYNDNNEFLGYENTAFEYDDNGNMIQKIVNGQVTSFFYNLEDRLERIEDGDGSVIASYYYDPFRRRLWKEAAGVRTYFVYSDEGLFAEVDPTGNVIKTYGYKPGSTWTTDPLFMKVGDKNYFYQNDHLGTPQKLTAVNGAVAWSAKYSSFGQADVDPSSTVTNNLRFPGQCFDQETGLHYNWFRYYLSDTGRYSKKDPVGFYSGINLYTFVLNNPITYTDPNGEWIVGAVIGGIAGAAGGINSAIINGGSLRSAILGGLAGGLAGAVVGGVLPDFVGIPASSTAGSILGSIVGGTTGGAVGGLVSSAVSGKVSTNSVLAGAATGLLSGAIAAPGIGLAAIATGGSEAGMAIMGATGSVMGDTVGAAGLKMWQGTSCEK
jgi:RHS repeat-associated protein